MNTYQGFSLTEVLISLCLITSTSIGLLTQQSTVAQLIHEINQRTHASIKLDNHSERHSLRVDIYSSSQALPYQKGISLTELMLSLFLSSLLISALMQHYLNTKQQYKQTQIALEQLSDLQLVSELIRNSVRHAGFTPCIGLKHLTSRDRRNEHTPLVAIAVNVGNHHALKFARMNEEFLTVQKVLGSTQLLLDGEFDKQYPILIADCFHAEVQKISHYQKTRQGILIALEKPLAFNYLAPIYVGEWLEEQFYIKTNSQKVPALFYRTNHQEELTTLIQALSTQLITWQKSLIVRVNLTFQQGNPIVLDTRIRTP